MVLVDEDLQTGARGDGANPGVRFHIWIYRNRPDVKAIVHTHAPYASALAATGKPLKTIHMDSAMLHGTAHLPEWPGVPVADDEGRIISGALGSAKTILLSNHGLLAAGFTSRKPPISRSSSSAPRACRSAPWPRAATRK